MEEDILRFRRLAFLKSNFDLCEDEIVPIPDLGSQEKVRDYIEKSNPVLHSFNLVYIPLDKLEIYKPIYTI